MRNLSNKLGYKDVRIDRASVLGNPYFMINESCRDEVRSAYRRWLWKAIQDNNNNPAWLEEGLKIADKYKCPTSKSVVLELKRLSEMQTNIRLLCWCAPKNCHGDIIKSCIHWMRGY